MAELIGSGGYDDVQNTAPTSPSIGDTWLDTSTHPPVGKVYADLGSGGQWTTDLLDAQISSRSSHDDPDPNGYIDQAISNAGKTATATDKNTQSEIQSGVDSSTTGSRVDTTVSSTSGINIKDKTLVRQGNLNESVSIDGFESVSSESETKTASITGEGYLIQNFDINWNVNIDTENDGNITFRFIIDGDILWSNSESWDKGTAGEGFSTETRSGGITYNNLFPVYFGSELKIEFDYNVNFQNTIRSFSANISLSQIDGNKHKLFLL